MQTVTRDNFVRAETDTYFANFAKDGAFGKMIHNRGFPDIDHQSVVRMNRDTLYSSGIFDLDAGPVTMTLPDAGQRFMSLLLISEDHYNPATYYGAGAYTISRDQVGTRYVALLVRTFVDPGDPADLVAVHALQDAIRIEQASTGSFEVPQWDQASLAQIRDELKQEGPFEPSKAFGTRETVDPEAHLVGTACGWGGNPAEDAVYIAGRPPKDDGTTVHRLEVEDVPVDGFWSVTVYNKDGYFEANPQNAYSLNNVTAKQDADGYFHIQFGGCDGQVPNCLPIMPGWNYTVRLYRPRAEILQGRWTFPEVLPVE
ncbi:DUF1254 domain-containing protein [Altererythrobacter sp. Root672]|uniref:DUF1254 domain-containing protein n=1 Tax=Altererythrobacter sp. Root672 TaxID=1736584 RepID=UPI0006F60EA5|nr:DUF1254 domain-containing protein [Altererythrobacter sp. Root672]KRA84241.1 carboxylesterase [Altererythrobacter sp. Root672]